MGRHLVSIVVMCGLVSANPRVLHAGSANAALRAAREAAAAGNDEAALSAASDALRQTNDTHMQVAVYALMATIYARAGRADDASVSYFEILARQPDFALPKDASPEELTALAAARGVTEPTAASGEQSEAAKLFAAAERAYEELDYEKVMPLSRRALKLQPEPQLAAQIFALMAYLSVSNGKPRQAKKSFIRVVELDPQYELPIGGSPKLRTLLDAAREEVRTRASDTEPPSPAQGEVPPAGEHATAPTSTDCAAPASPAGSQPATGAVDPMPELLTASCGDCGMFYTRWWFWMIVGTVVAGSGAAVAALITQRSTVPPYDYGPIDLR